MTIAILSVRRALGRLLSRWTARPTPPPPRLMLTVYCPPNRVDACVSGGIA